MFKTYFLTSMIAVALAGGALAHAPGARVSDGAPITRQEAVQRADRLFDMLDANHDGLLTRSEARYRGAELKVERASSGVDVAPGLGGHTARHIEHRFAQARSITRDQFEKAFLAHFDEMDHNHDGILTPEERAQAQ